MLILFEVSSLFQVTGLLDDGLSRLTRVLDRILHHPRGLVEDPAEDLQGYPVLTRTL